MKRIFRAGPWASACGRRRRRLPWASGQRGSDGWKSGSGVDEDAHALIELVEPMLQARERGVVLGADVGEVGSRSIALNEIELAETEAVAGGVSWCRVGSIVFGLFVSVFVFVLRVGIIDEGAVGFVFILSVGARGGRAAEVADVIELAGADE